MALVLAEAEEDEINVPITALSVFRDKGVGLGAGCEVRAEGPSISLYAFILYF